MAWLPVVRDTFLDRPQDAVQRTVEVKYLALRRVTMIGREAFANLAGRFPHSAPVDRVNLSRKCTFEAPWRIYSPPFSPASPSPFSSCSVRLQPHRHVRRVV